MMSRIVNAVLLISFSSASLALAADIPDSGRLLRESIPVPALAPRQELPNIPQPAEQQAPTPNGVSVRVSGFIFMGNTIFTSDELAALLAGHVGTEMTLPELNGAAATITNAYRGKGYFLASAFIPPQTIKADSPVIVEVVEGILEGVALETTPAETRVPKSVLQGYASQVPVNKPAEEGALTSMVMMVNELPNISSRILLEPGVRPGATAAKIEVTEGKPYGAYLDTDNHGYYSTGYYRVGAGLELYSPLSLGDQLTLRAQTTTSGDNQTFRLGYAAPVNSVGTKVGVDYSYVKYQLGRSFEALDGHGDAHNYSLTVTQPLARSRNLILNATLAGEGKQLDDRIDSVNSKNQRHSASVQAGLSGVEMDPFLGGGSTSFSLGYINGNLDIDDAATLANDQAPTGLKTEGGYAKINMNLARTQTIYKDISMYVGGYGQWADKNLDSGEQISLGGPSAVRAFDTGEASGDKGFVSTAELRYLFDQLGVLPGNLQLIGFVDYGHVKLHADPIAGSTDNTRNLTGAGFGLNWLDPSSFSVKTTVAWKTAGETTPTDSPMVYFQAVKRF